MSKAVMSGVYYSSSSSHKETILISTQIIRAKPKNISRAENLQGSRAESVNLDILRNPIGCCRIRCVNLDIQLNDWLAIRR